MHAINGRLESIILLGYKEVFCFKAETKLKTNHWHLISLCVHWTVLLFSRKMLCIFLTLCRVSFLFALLTRLTLTTATKRTKWGTRERNSNTAFQNALLHSLSWKYDYSFLCQYLQLFDIWFKLWPWSYNKPLWSGGSSQGRFISRMEGWLVGRSDGVIALSVCLCIRGWSLYTCMYVGHTCIRQILLNLMS